MEIGDTQLNPISCRSCGDTDFQKIDSEKWGIPIHAFFCMCNNCGAIQDIRRVMRVGVALRGCLAVTAALMYLHTAVCNCYIPVIM
jgi:hypothetical protein